MNAEQAAERDSSADELSNHPENGDSTGAETNATAPAVNLAEILQERDKYKEIALRTRAEFENYQKRVARDLQTERQYAVQPLARELLPVVDNLERAIESARGKPELAGLLEGIELVRKLTLDAFAKFGIERVDPVDQPFDPNLHQAVVQQPSGEKPPMTVLQTLQTGYRMHERVLRPAQVLVSSAPADSAHEVEASSSEG